MFWWIPEQVGMMGTKLNYYLKTEHIGIWLRRVYNMLVPML